MKQTADNYEGINNELEHVQVKFRKDKQFNHATGKVEEKSTGRFVIFDKDDPTNMNVITHTDLMRYDVSAAKSNGGTIKALRESRPTKKKGANTSTNKPGQTEHTVQTTNIAWDTFTNYIRGIEDFYESNPSALVTKLREAKNQDVALNIGKVTLEGLRAMLMSPDVFTKLMGDDIYSELETKFADVRKRMTKAA